MEHLIQPGADDYPRYHPKSHNFIPRLATTLVAVAVFGLIAIAASAEEPRQGGPFMLAQGLLCDSQDEVRVFLEALDNRGNATVIPPGCGKVNRPVPIMWRIVEDYDARHGTAEIAEYTIIGATPPTQFGIWKWTPKVINGSI